MIKVIHLWEPWNHLIRSEVWRSGRIRCLEWQEPPNLGEIKRYQVSVADKLWIVIWVRLWGILSSALRVIRVLESLRNRNL